MSSDLWRNTGCRTHSNVTDLLLLLYVLWSPKEDLLELWHALGQWPPKENLLQPIKESLLSDPLHSCDMFSNLQRKLEDLLLDPFQHNRPTPAFMICPLTAKGRPAPTHIVCPPTSKGRFAVRCTPLLWYVLWPPKEDLLSDPLLSYDMSSDLQRKICCQTHSYDKSSDLQRKICYQTCSNSNDMSSDLKGRTAVRPTPLLYVLWPPKEDLLSDPLLSYMSSDLQRKICYQTRSNSNDMSSDLKGRTAVRPTPLLWYVLWPPKEDLLSDPLLSYDMSSDLQRKICCQTHSTPMISPLTSKGRSAIRPVPTPTICPLTSKEELLSDPLLSYMSSDLQRKICCQTHSSPICPLTSKGRSAIRPVPTPTICPLTSKEELLSDPLLSYDMSSDLRRKICCQTHSTPICPLTSKGRSAVRPTHLLYVLWPPKEDLLSDTLLSYNMSSDLQRKICCQTHSTPMICPMMVKEL